MLRRRQKLLGDIQTCAERRLDATREICDAPIQDGAEIIVAADFIRGNRDAERRLTADLKACENELGCQRERLTEAKRKRALLEKLRDRHKSEWELEDSKEQESLASELHLVQWLRTQKAGRTRGILGDHHS